MFPLLEEFDFNQKRILLRCDFNVPLKNGKVLNDFKIKKTLPTINYLKAKKGKIILISHLGRPQKIKDKSEREKRYTLAPIKKRLEKLLDQKIKFWPKITSSRTKKETLKLKGGEILLLENLRFLPEEENNDPQFAKFLATLGDCYVGEAFGVCHRFNASVAILPKLLPHFVGFQFQKEIENLSKIFQNPLPPLVVIIGGAKIDSKIKVIERFLKLADHLLLGGKVGSTILTVKGITIGKPWPSKEIVKVIEQIPLTDPKIHLPIDVLVSPDEQGTVYIRETGPGGIRKDEEVFDIGQETIKTFSKILKEAKTIFWSGPLGFFENKKFSQGTEKIAQAIAHHYKAFRVAGGGETVQALKEFGVLEKFSFVSTGGGAMLAFLAGETLTGLEALKK